MHFDINMFYFSKNSINILLCINYYLLPRIISLVDFDCGSVDNKSDIPTVANPIIIVNIPNQWRTDTCRWTKIFENIAVNIITAPS